MFRKLLFWRDSLRRLWCPRKNEDGWLEGYFDGWSPLHKEEILRQSDVIESFFYLKDDNERLTISNDKKYPPACRFTRVLLMHIKGKEWRVVSAHRCLIVYAEAEDAHKLEVSWHLKKIHETDEAMIVKNRHDEYIFLEKTKWPNEYMPRIGSYKVELSKEFTIHKDGWCIFSVKDLNAVD